MKSQKLPHNLIYMLVVTSISAICSFGAPISLATAQDSSNEQANDKLPKHAVWRIGDHGKTPNTNGIYRIVYSPNGKYLATRNQENIVQIYDTNTHEEILSVEPHEERVLTIDFSQDSNFFMTAAGPNEKIKIWSMKTGKPQAEIDTDGTAAFFDKAGTGINVLGEKYVEKYSWPGVQMTDQSKWKSTNEKRISMSRNGRYVIAYRHLNRQTYQTVLVDCDSKSKIVLSGSNALPKSGKFSPNNNWLAATYRADFKVRLWDLRDPTKRKYSLSAHKSTAQSISFSSDSRFLVSSGWDRKVFTWDLLTRQQISEFTGHTDNVNSTAFKPLSYSFASGASGTTDCSAIEWNMKSLLFKPEHKPDPSSTSPVEEQFEAIWRSLGTSSFNVSIKSTATFAQSGNLYLDAFEKLIAPQLTTTGPSSLDQTIAELGHPEFAVRDRATKQLLKLKKRADAKLRIALNNTTSLEIRYRISRILKQKAPRGKSDLVESRRWQRALFALEEINSERSRKILKTIADGHEDTETAAAAHECYLRCQLKNKSEDQ